MSNMRYIAPYTSLFQQEHTRDQCALIIYRNRHNYYCIELANPKSEWFKLLNTPLFSWYSQANRLRCKKILNFRHFSLLECS